MTMEGLQFLLLRNGVLRFGAVVLRYPNQKILPEGELVALRGIEPLFKP